MFRRLETLYVVQTIGNIICYSNDWKHYVLLKRLETLYVVQTIGNIICCSDDWKHYMLFRRLETLYVVLMIGNIIYVVQMIVNINKLSPRITRKTARMPYRLSMNNSGTENCLRIGRNAVEFDPDEYQKFKYHRYVQKSYVPTPPRPPVTIWEQSQTFLINIGRSSVSSHNLL